MNSKRIGLDLDGVLADFSKAFSELLREMYGTHLPLVLDKEQVINWDWDKWYPLEKSKIDLGWTALGTDPDFWCKIDLCNKDEFETLKTSIGLNPLLDTYFITTRQNTGGQSAVKQSAKWLANHGWNCPQVISDTRKGFLANALNLEYFIDDSGRNCLDILSTAPQCKVYLLDYPHNRKMSFPPELRKVNSLYEFILDVLGNK